MNKIQAEKKFSYALKNSEAEYENYFLSNFFDFNYAYINETCIIEFEVEEYMYNSNKMLHGGVAAFALDASMGHLCKNIVGKSATVEMKVQYLRAVNSGKMVCKASFLKKGKNISYLESKLENEQGKLIAMATATFMKI